MDKVLFLLNNPKDLSIARLLFKISPIPIQFIITNFDARDKYGWKKPKQLECWFSDDSIKDIKLALRDNITICTSEKDLQELWRESDVCISKGREFFVLKSPSKRNIALSFDRCYFSRLLDILPYYKDALTIVLSSPIWLDEKFCGYYEMDPKKHTREYIDKYRKNFKFVDISNYYYETLQKMGKENIRKELGLPLDKKIAFFSFRMSTDQASIHKNTDDFVCASKKMLEKFKEDNYFIISRRRMGRQDLLWYKNTNHPEVSRFKEIFHLIDMEINGFGGFPELIYRGIYASDIMLLSDLSGIARTEGLFCRCPIYMPFEKNKENIGRISYFPIIKDMVDNGIIFNEYNQSSMDEYYKNVENLIQKWHSYDLDGFWNIIKGVE